MAGLSPGEQELRLFLLEEEYRSLSSLRAAAGGANVGVWGWGELIRLDVAPRLGRLLQDLLLFSAHPEAIWRFYMLLTPENVARSDNSMQILGERLGGVGGVSMIANARAGISPEMMAAYAAGMRRRAMNAAESRGISLVRARGGDPSSYTAAQLRSEFMRHLGRLGGAATNAAAQQLAGAAGLTRPDGSARGGEMGFIGGAKALIDDGATSAEVTERLREAARQAGLASNAAAQQLTGPARITRPDGSARGAELGLLGGPKAAIESGATSDRVTERLVEVTRQGGKASNAAAQRISQPNGLMRADNTPRGAELAFVGGHKAAVQSGATSDAVTERVVEAGRRGGSAGSLQREMLAVLGAFRGAGIRAIQTVDTNGSPRFTSVGTDGRPGHHFMARSPFSNGLSQFATGKRIPQIRQYVKTRTENIASKTASKTAKSKQHTRKHDAHAELIRAVAVDIANDVSLSGDQRGVLFWLWMEALRIRHNENARKSGKGNRFGSTFDLIGHFLTQHDSLKRKRHDDDSGPDSGPAGSSTANPIKV